MALVVHLASRGPRRARVRKTAKHEKRRKLEIESFWPLTMASVVVVVVDDDGRRLEWQWQWQGQWQWLSADARAPLGAARGPRLRPPRVGAPPTAPPDERRKKRPGHVRRDGAAAARGRLPSDRRSAAAVVPRYRKPHHRSRNGVGSGMVALMVALVA